MGPSDQIVPLQQFSSGQHEVNVRISFWISRHITNTATKKRNPRIEEKLFFHIYGETDILLFSICVGFISVARKFYFPFCGKTTNILPHRLLHLKMS